MADCVSRLADVIELQVSLELVREQAARLGLSEVAAVATVALRLVREVADEAEREVELDERAAEVEEDERGEDAEPEEGEA